MMLSYYNPPSIIVQRLVPPESIAFPAELAAVRIELNDIDLLG